MEQEAGALDEFEREIFISNMIAALLPTGVYVLCLSVLFLVEYQVTAFQLVGMNFFVTFAWFLASALGVISVTLSMHNAVFQQYAALSDGVLANDEREVVAGEIAASAFAWRMVGRSERILSKLRGAALALTWRLILLLVPWFLFDITVEA